MSFKQFAECLVCLLILCAWHQKRWPQNTRCSHIIHVLFRFNRARIEVTGNFPCARSSRWYYHESLNSCMQLQVNIIGHFLSLNLLDPGSIGMLATIGSFSGHTAYALQFLGCCSPKIIVERLVLRERTMIPGNEVSFKCRHSWENSIARRVFSNDTWSWQLGKRDIQRSLNHGRGVFPH